MKRKRPRIDHFFKPIGSSSQPDVQPSEENDQGPENDPNNVEIDAQIDTDISDIHVPEVTEQATIITTPYDRDPGRRLQIWELPPDKQNDARRFYISEGPYQPKLDEYPFTGTGSSRRRFQSSWFTNFSWLEYSPHTNCAYCLPCFLFSKKPVGKCRSDTFSVKGFDKWKKVNNGKDCAFLTHMGSTPSSAHNYAVRCYESLKNSMTHIDKVIVKQCKKRVADARLRIKVSIDVIK
jgi:hypothetical protein